MSHRQRQRKAFRGAGLESLEGREMLSHASAALAHSRGANAAVYGAARLNAIQVRAEELQLRRELASTVLGKASLAGASTPSSLIAAPATTPSGANPALGYSTSTAAARLASLTAMSQQAAGYSVTPAGSTATPVQYSQGLPMTTGSVVASTSGSSTAATPSATTAPTTTAASTPANAGSATPPGAATPGMLGNLTLSQTDLTQLGSLTQQFVSSYTGTGSTADAAAISAFQTGLTGLSQGVWSETHVASASSVAALQKAVDSFAGTYTSGQTPSTDSAAWSALGSAFQSFATGLTNPAATSGGTTTANPVPSSTSPALAGSLVDPSGGPGLAAAFAPLFTGPSLTASEVGQLGTIVGTFTSAYKPTDPATESAALSAFQTSLSGLVGSHLGGTSASPMMPVGGTTAFAMRPFLGTVSAPMMTATTTGQTSTAGSSSTTTAAPMMTATTTDPTSTAGSSSTTTAANGTSTTAPTTTASTTTAANGTSTTPTGMG